MVELAEPPIKGMVPGVTREVRSSKVGRIFVIVIMVKVVNG